TKQLHKLIDVIKVTDMSEHEYVEREMALIRVKAEAASRAEVLRVIDALQLTDKYTVATPGNWRRGDDVIIPLSLQDEAVIKQKFPKGYKAPKPYLRITPHPGK
ncbi:MAG: hypothetical protein Q7U14_18340, partial [Lacisediminimonas sp.]|nr:hypothetical protein [Lacisediminimonas sp.]